MSAKVGQKTPKTSGKPKGGAAASAVVEAEEVQTESPEQMLKDQALWKKKRRAYWSLQFAKVLDTLPPAKAKVAK
jgi:hypothetical protein